MKIRNVFAIAALLWLAVPAASQAAPTVTTVYNFTGETGATPSNGNLLLTPSAVYAAAYGGGSDDLGTIVSVPKAAGSAASVVHVFTGPDGAHPNGGLMADSAGNIYGTTQRGGANDSGTVFKLTPTGGAWVLTTLHSFGCTEGGEPAAGVTLGPDGSIYGTTYGAAEGCPDTTPLNVGSLFKITPAGSFNLVHSFVASNAHEISAEGGGVRSNVILDPDGDAIVTTTGDIGPSQCGELVAVKSTGVTTIVGPGSFNCELFSSPVGNLVRDASSGSVYGMADAVVYSTPAGAALWRITAVTHRLSVVATIPGADSRSGIVRDNAGNFYGTFTGAPVVSVTSTSLPPRNSGGVFVVSAAGQASVYASFTPDSAGPIGGVVIDTDGSLWGTSSAGGDSCTTSSNLTPAGCGTIFRITP